MLMHPALWKLFRMRIWSTLRRLLSSMKTIRGAIIVLLGVGFFGFLIFQGLVAGLAPGNQLRSAVTPSILEAAPIALVGLTLVSIFSSAGERAIFFSPSEVDFLFAGPFSRKQLLVYKLASTVFGAIATSIFIWLTTLAYVPWWPSALCATFSAFLFMHAVTLNVALLGQTIAESTFTTGRKVAGAVVLIVAVAASAQAAAAIPDEGWLKGLQAFSNSIPGQILLAPAYTFKQLFAADNWVSLAVWFIPSCLINFGLLTLAIQLDANYLEAAANVSRKIDQRMRRARRSGAGAVMASTKAESEWSLPAPPRLGGVGLVTWLQLSCGLRTARGFLVFLVIVMVAAASVGGAIAMKKELDADKMAGISIGAIAYLSFLLSMNPPLGFRANGDQIPFLKTLPLSPLAIACGETAGISLIVTALQWVLLIGVLIAVGYSPWLIWAALLAIPYNIITFGLDNTAFLLYPSQMTPGAPGDINVFGRVMVQSLIKILCLALIAIPISIAGVLAWLASGKLTAIPIAVLASMILVDVLLIYVMAWAFRRFDPSMDQIAN